MLTTTPLPPLLPPWPLAGAQPIPCGQAEVGKYAGMDWGIAELVPFCSAKICTVAYSTPLLVLLHLWHNQPVANPGLEIALHCLLVNDMD